MSVNFFHVLHIDNMTSYVVQLIYDFIRNTDYLKFFGCIPLKYDIHLPVKRQVTFQFVENICNE